MWKHVWEYINHIVVAFAFAFIAAVIYERYHHAPHLINLLLYVSIFAIFAVFIAERFRRRKKKIKALKEIYSFIGKSKPSSLTPDKVWEGIRLGKYNKYNKPNKYYYPRPEEDGLINNCLKNKKNVLIIGLPLSGKTIAAYQALTNLNELQKVAIPRCADIKLEDFRFPKTSIIFINDLHEFVDKQGFERLWNATTDVKNNVTIIATCQSAEMKKVENKIKDLRGIFEEKSIIELPRISEAEAREIANKVEIDWKGVEFDGTIGSVFLRLDEMRRRFNAYDSQDPKRHILQVLRSLYMCGIYEEKQVFPLKWIKKIATKKIGLDGEDYQWNAWLDDLRDKEFITFAGKDRVRAEETHLKVVVKPPGTGEILDVSEDTITAFSDEPEALFRLGNRANTIRNVEIAIKAYTCVLDINPRYAKAYYNRGFVYDDKELYDLAIEDYSRAIKINPSYAEAYNNRGIAYYKKGEYDRAIADYNKALEINPRLAEAYTNRGLAYYNKGEYDRAIDDYNKALELNPRYAKAYNNRAVAYYYKKEYDKAWEDVHKVKGLGLQVPPEFLDALRQASGRER